MLYKRGRIWWVKIAVGGARPTRESTGTTDRELAQEYHDRRAAELWRVHRLGERPRTAFADVALDWLTTHSAHKRSHEDDKLRLSTMLPYLPDGPVDGLTTQAMTVIRDRLRADRETDESMATLAAHLRDLDPRPAPQPDSLFHRERDSEGTPL